MLSRKHLYLLGSFILGTIIYLMDFGLEPQAHAVFTVLCIAALLWFTEAVPLHVTALFIPFLLVVLANFSTKTVFSPFFDPVVILLMGGFVLAYALQKHHLDEEIAYFSVNKIGTSPRRFLLGMMIVAAFLSMWMSNTATTAVMIPIALVVLRKNGLKPLKSSYGKAVVLGIAYAATLGGLSTIVGTTPNAIAVKFLADEGITVTFASWMAHALPIVIIMVPIVWMLLSFMYKPEIKKLKVRKHTTKLLKQQKLVLGVFATTVLLWLTTEIHGLSSSMVALVPVFLVYILSLYNVEDFGKIHWDILVLIGGGLSLGMAMSESGLNIVIADLIQTYIAGHTLIVMFFLIAIFCIAMTLFSSNTGTAAFVIPIMIPLALSLGIDLKSLVILAGIAVSLDFIVPIGTPPNAIAYSSGYVRVKDMVKAGVIISTIGAIVLSTNAWLFW